METDHIQPPSPRFRPEPLTLSLLLLALSTLFLCSIDKGYFYRTGHPGWNTVHNLAIAENLSSDHQFRLFKRRIQGPGDDPIYDIYSRFPIGAYVLIKLAILPFGNDLSARILAARMLMLLLFSGAALLAFHSLARITSHRWVALAATLAAFSSYYMLSYANVVAVEYSVDLFAVMLAFHGMVVFVQEGRFRQLLAKTGVALLLGWHVYAFLLPFILLGLAREAVRAWKDGTAPWPRARSIGTAVLRSRYTALGVAALLFGMAVLSFNFANEYAAFGGEIAVTELPSFQSMLTRTRLNADRYPPPDWWLRFLRQQFFRVGFASVPFVLTDWGADLFNRFPPLHSAAPGLWGTGTSLYLLLLLLATGAAAVVVRLARPLLAGRSRILLATLALSGFCWALPMRHNVAHSSHDHEAMFYVGVPLVFYSLLLLYVHKRWGRGPVVGLAAAALLVFVVSAFQMERLWRPGPRAAEFQQAVVAELGAIRETIRGKAVLLVLGSVRPEGSWQLTYEVREWRYYLAGSVWGHSLHMAFLSAYSPRNYLSGSGMTRFRDTEAAARAADFIVTLDRVESDALLTPGNERVFLYDATGIDDLVELYRATYQRVVSGEPAARSEFDVYLDDGALYHVKEPCVPEDVGDRVFAEMFPADPKDLPRWRRRWHGFRQVTILEPSIPFQYSGVVFEGKCMAILPLPDYPVSGIRTGQDLLFRRPGRQGDRGWAVKIGSLRRPPGSPTP